MGVIKLIRDTVACLLAFWFIFAVLPEFVGAVADVIDRLQAIGK